MTSNYFLYSKNQSWKTLAYILTILLQLPLIHNSHSQELKIMTYNIHHGTDVDGENTLNDIGEYIMKSRIDIVGLQEVDSICERSNNIDQPEQLGKLTGLEHYFTRHFAYQGGSYGQALLTKHQVSTVENVSLPVFPLSSGKSVSMLVATIIVDGKEITLAIAHLDYRSKESRLHQISVLWNYLKNKNNNLVLMGDLNALPESEEMKELRKNFNVFPHSDNDFTFPSVDPDRRIDFVMVRKNSDLKIVAEHIGDVKYSDHLPVVTRVECRK